MRWRVEPTAQQHARIGRAVRIPSKEPHFSDDHTHRITRRKVQIDVDLTRIGAIGIRTYALPEYLGGQLRIARGWSSGASPERNICYFWAGCAARAISHEIVSCIRIGISYRWHAYSPQHGKRELLGKVVLDGNGQA